MTTPLELVIVLAIVAGLVLFLSAPLRRPETAPSEQDVGTDDVAELEAAREAKYRELRDAELDHRTGKLSDEDYAELDAALRAEAIEILRALDRSSEAKAPPLGAADQINRLPSPRS